MAKPVLDLIHPIAKSIPAALIGELNCGVGYRRGVPLDTSSAFISDLPKRANPLGCPVPSLCSPLIPVCSSTKCLISHYLRPDNAPWID